MSVGMVNSGRTEKVNESKCMEEITLSRTDKRSLTFIGEVAASATSWGPKKTRWTKAVVYYTDQHKYVLGLARITQWVGEDSVYTATPFETKDEVMEYLETYASEVAEEIAKRLGMEAHV